MITFETQQDFENAVMKVVRERLQVRVSMRKSYCSDGEKTTVVYLDDVQEEHGFSRDEDYA